MYKEDFNEEVANYLNKAHIYEKNINRFTAFLS